MNDVKTSYLFWIVWIFGAAGLHRLYNKKIFTGLLWMFTFGLFGIGQLVDLFLIPNMVEEHNVKARARLGVSPYGVPLGEANVQAVIYNSDISTPPVPTHDQLMLKLLRAAQARGGKLSVTQAVLDTECGFTEVEFALKAMVKMGYVAIENDPITGVVVYDFVEL